VEFLRSTYSSQWRLFADPAVPPVKGEYRRVISGTPFLQIPHNFASLNWKDAQFDDFASLGQSTRTTRWTAANPLSPTPNFIPSGTPSQITYGDMLPYSGTLIEGLPNECFQQTTCLQFLNRTTPTARSSWVLYATVIRMLYDPMSNILLYVTSQLGSPLASEISLDGSGVTPQFAIFVYPCATLVFVAGTTNYQQAALQILYSGNGPTDQGLYSTNRVWQLAANYITDRIRLLSVSPPKRLYFGGHSYGAAISRLVASQIAHGGLVTEGVKLFTIGSPRAGDIRLYTILKDEDVIDIQNEGDPVPALPPPYNPLVEFLPILGIALLNDWERFAPPAVRTLLKVDGSLSETSGFGSNYDVNWSLASSISSGTLPPLYAAHSSAEYEARLKLVPGAIS